MSKSLVFKGLSFVKKGQGGKPPPVGIYVKERKGVVTSVAARGSEKESRFKSKGTLQDRKDSHGRISKSGGPKMDIKERATQREVTSKQRTDETNQPFRGKNIGLFGFKRKRSRRMIKNLSQYVAESKSIISRRSVNAPSLPPRLIKGSVAAKAERKAQRQMQFNVLNIPELGNSGWLA